MSRKIPSRTNPDPTLFSAREKKSPLFQSGETSGIGFGGPDSHRDALGLAGRLSGQTALPTGRLEGQSRLISLADSSGMAV